MGVAADRLPDPLLGGATAAQPIVRLEPSVAREFAEWNSAAEAKPDRPQEKTPPPRVETSPRPTNEPAEAVPRNHPMRLNRHPS